MNNIHDILEISNTLDFKFPKAFMKTVELNLIDFDIWYLLDKESFFERYAGLKDRYPTRTLIPFAKRDDCDDVACFELDKPNKVEIIHDFASEGYEQKKEYNNFWDWLKSAIDEMIEFNEEEFKYEETNIPS